MSMFPSFELEAITGQTRYGKMFSFLGQVYETPRGSKFYGFAVFRKVQIFISQSTDFHSAKYRFSFRKVQIFISQSTDFRFAKYRFSFRKVQISFRFVSFRKVPFRKVQ